MQDFLDTILNTNYDPAISTYTDLRDGDVMQTTRKPHLSDDRNLDPSNVRAWRAVGHVRVSTAMQATDGLSLDAQTAAIDQCCSLHGLKLRKTTGRLLTRGLRQPIIWVPPSS